MFEKKDLDRTFIVLTQFLIALGKPLLRVCVYFILVFFRGQTGAAACTFYSIQGPVSPGARGGQTMGSG